MAKRNPKLDKDDVLRRVHGAVETGQYRILPHARQRRTERDVSAPDIENALETGHHVPRRDRYDEPSADGGYCFEGSAVDGERLRVVVAFQHWMVVVTVVRLDGGRED